MIVKMLSTSENDVRKWKKGVIENRSTLTWHTIRYHIIDHKIEECFCALPRTNSNNNCFLTEKKTNHSSLKAMIFGCSNVHKRTGKHVLAQNIKRMRAHTHKQNMVIIEKYCRAVLFCFRFQPFSNFCII